MWPKWGCVETWEAPVDNSLLSWQEARGGVRARKERRAPWPFIIEGKYLVLAATNNDLKSKSLVHSLWIWLYASVRQSGKLPWLFDLETIRESQTQKTVCVVCRQEGLPAHDLVRLMSSDHWPRRGDRGGHWLAITHHLAPCPGLYHRKVWVKVESEGARQWPPSLCGEERSNLGNFGQSFSFSSSFLNNYREVLTEPNPFFSKSLHWRQKSRNPDYPGSRLLLGQSL